MKRVILVILFVFISFSAYGEDSIEIKEYANGKFKVLKGDQILSKSSFDWWDIDVHDNASYVLFDSLEKAQEAISENKNKDIVKRTIPYTESFSWSADDSNITYQPPIVTCNLDNMSNTVDNESFTYYDGENNNVVYENFEVNGTIKKEKSVMSFVIDVFGANLVIAFSIFIYLFMAVFAFKNFLKDRTDDSELDIFLSLVWPATSIIYLVIFIMIGKGFPFVYKCFDKIVPNVSIEKDDK